MNRIAIIAAHPDDEALGCGGTILKAQAKGAEIYFLFLTDGISGRKETSTESISARSLGIKEAINYISPQYSKLLDFPDNKLDSVPILEVIQEIERFIDETKPSTIFTHFYNDLNIDHALTCKAVITATRPGSTRFVNQMYSFEVPSSTEWAIGQEIFRPTTFIDITDHIDKKMDYLKCYDKEMRQHPHPRSYENMRSLNQIRGAQIAVPFAEAFVTIRNIVDVL